MADTTSLLDDYFARFGDDGDFDRWILPGPENRLLMERALERGTPVTDREVKARYRVLYGVTYQDPPEGAVT